MNQPRVLKVAGDPCDLLDRTLDLKGLGRDSKIEYKLALREIGLVTIDGGYLASRDDQKVSVIYLL